MTAAPVAAWHFEGLSELAQRFDLILLGTSSILAFALLGLVEDLFSVPATARFGIQLGLGLALGTATAIEVGAPLWTSVAVAVCAAGLINATNFMDGANGLAAGHGVVGGLWYVVVALSAPLHGLGFVMIALAGACAGFLPFNAPRARVFLGDTGSYALGGAWAFAATVCLASGVPSPAAVAPLLVLVGDTGYTLWMRVRAGQRWYEPHKLHVYQRLVSAGWAHWGVAVLVSGTALVSCALGWLALRGLHPVFAGALQILVVVAYLRLPALVHAPDPFHRSRGVR